MNGRVIQRQETSIQSNQNPLHQKNPLHSMKTPEIFFFCNGGSVGLGFPEGCPITMRPKPLLKHFADSFLRQQSLRQHQLQLGPLRASVKAATPSAAVSLSSSSSSSSSRGHRKQASAAAWAWSASDCFFLSFFFYFSFSFPFSANSS